MLKISLFAHNLAYLRHVSICLDHQRLRENIIKVYMKNTVGLLNTFVLEMSADIITFIFSSAELVHKMQGL